MAIGFGQLKGEFLAQPVKVGQPIPLALQLSDDNGALYVQAQLKDGDGVDLPGSPVQLGHVGGGLYISTTQNFPAISQVHAIYRVYDDAGFTERSVDHFATVTDIFYRDVISEAINSLATTSGELRGEQLFGTILEDQGFLTGSIQDGEMLFGSVEDMESLSGVILEPETLQGLLPTSEELVGILEC